MPKLTSEAVVWWHRMNCTRWRFLQSPFASENQRRVAAAFKVLQSTGVTIETGKDKGMHVVLESEDGWGFQLAAEKLSRDGKGYVLVPLDELKKVGKLDQAMRTYLA